MPYTRSSKNMKIKSRDPDDDQFGEQYKAFYETYLVKCGEEAELGVVRSALEDTATFDRRRAPTAPAEGLWLERVE